MNPLQNTQNFMVTLKHQMTITQKLSLALGMACTTGLLAQLKLPLPWTPVPITSQTLAVLLAGVILGNTWGSISLAIYVSLGAAGLPWFAGGSSGLTKLAGPTGGYLIGFIVSAWVIGYIVDTYPKVKTWWRLVGIMLLCNFFVIHLLGLMQLYCWLSLVQRTPATLCELLLMGSLPFIYGDIIKIIIAATLATGIIARKKQPL